MKNPAPLEGAGFFRWCIDSRKGPSAVEGPFFCGLLSGAV
jgi:hypothetical protein